LLPRLDRIGVRAGLQVAIRALVKIHLAVGHVRPRVSVNESQRAQFIERLGRRAVGLRARTSNRLGGGIGARVTVGDALRRVGTAGGGWDGAVDQPGNDTLQAARGLLFEPENGDDAAGFTQRRSSS
jgi:hypothetical protein